MVRIRDAARELGRPVDVLRALRDCGTFEVNHQLRDKPGFHRLDGKISVDRALSRVCHTIERRVSLIACIRSGAMQAFGDPEQQ